MTSKVVELDSYQERKTRRRLQHAARRGAFSLGPRRLAAAASEVATKSQAQVNEETAATWAARAVAYRAAAKRAAPGSEAACEAWRGYDDARHEALEHAALVGDGGETVAAVESLLDDKRGASPSKKTRLTRQPRKSFG